MDAAGQNPNFVSSFVDLRADLTGYTIRKETVRQTSIGGLRAVQAIADFRESGKRMSETLTWIVSERATAVFFARADTDQLPALQGSFDELINSAVVR
jgi:hypothetical protein